MGEKDAEIGRLRGQLAAAQTQNGGLGTELGGLRSAMGGKDRELKGLRDQLAQLEGQNRDARDENRGLRSRLVSCEETTAQVRNLGSELARTKQQLEQIKQQRRDIASSVSKSLNEHGVQAQVNPASGSITLSMDEAFRFKNGSAELTDSAKEKLRQIMPVYAAKIFSGAGGGSSAKPKLLTITGHASPRFNKRYVEPGQAPREASRFNQELSQKRAEQIAAFIFGAEIGDYPNKYRLKAISKVAGRGHSEPLRLQRGLASAEPCGKYDCAKSRRVELSFVLEGEEP
jgi:outer membrane protein OmpA-like peptidoglycan-associated protein